MSASGDRHETRAARRGIAILAGVALAAALLEWILFRKIATNEPFYWRITVRQFALVAGLEVAVLLACWPLAPWLRLRRVALASLLGLVLLALLSLYAANFLSRLYLSSSLDRSIVLQTLEALPHAWDAQPISTATIGAGLLAVALGVVALAWRASRELVAVLDLGRLPRPLAAAVVLFCLGGIGAWIYMAVHPTAWYVDTLRLATLPDPGNDLAIRLARSPVPLKPATPRNIIVILSDSLRADHFPHYGYPRMTTPFLAELAQSGHLRQAEWASSTCPETPCGVLATLLSNRIGRAAHNDNVALHTLLKDAGYRVAFLLSGAHLRQVVLKATYGDRATFDVLSDGQTTKRGTDDRQLLDGLDRLGPAGTQPSFLFFFLMSTHFIGQKRPEHRLWTPELSMLAAGARSLGSGGQDPLSPPEHAAAVNAYDNGLHQMDDTTRALFARLKALGYLDDAIVFISADHAEALGEHGVYTHGTHLYPEFLRVPLFIYDTSERRWPAIPFASQTDIAATAAAAAGLPIPSSWDGLDLGGAEQRRIGFVQNSRLFEQPCRGLYWRPAGELYYLLTCLGGREELFNLTADPLGRRDILATADAAIVAEMRERRRAAFGTFRNLY